MSRTNYPENLGILLADKYGDKGWSSFKDAESGVVTITRWDFTSLGKRPTISDAWVLFDTSERDNLSQDIEAYAKSARLSIVDHADYVKVGQYNAQVALAALIISGVATERQIGTALETKFAKKHGYTVDHAEKNPLALAYLWIEMSMQMMDDGNVIDTMSGDAMTAVENASDDQLDALKASLKQNADQALPELLGILENQG